MDSCACNDFIGVEVPGVKVVVQRRAKPCISVGLARCNVGSASDKCRLQGGRLL